jgi:hypothetical protein
VPPRIDQGTVVPFSTYLPERMGSITLSLLARADEAIE